MGIIGWIVFGGIAGWIASLIFKGKGHGLFGNIIVGVIGAFVGGFITSLFDGKGVDGFNISSFAIAVIGALVFLWIYSFIGGKKD